MREPPADVTADDVLTALRAFWELDVDAAEHLPVGFGAHHWAASSSGRRAWFVTLDGLLPRHSVESLEAAYAGAAALAPRLDFVLACLPRASGDFTAPFADGALSVVPWLGEATEAGEDVRTTAGMLERLHASSLADIPPWEPLLADPTAFADGIEASLHQPWDTGPYGEAARQALDQQIGDIRRWAGRYGDLAAIALDHRDRWVPTHGEPDPGNQLVAHGRRFLVDWESLKLAPRERDLWALGPGWESSYSARADRDLLELFDLQWRLDEIGCFATWFSAPHSGSESDQVALQGLLDELERA